MPARKIYKTEEERKTAARVGANIRRMKKRREAGIPPVTRYASDEERKAALRSAQSRYRATGKKALWEKQFRLLPEQIVALWYNKMKSKNARSGFLKVVSY